MPVCRALCIRRKVLVACSPSSRRRRRLTAVVVRATRSFFTHILPLKKTKNTRERKNAARRHGTAVCLHQVRSGKRIRRYLFSLPPGKPFLGIIRRVYHTLVSGIFFVRFPSGVRTIEILFRPLRLVLDFRPYTLLERDTKLLGRGQRSCFVSKHSVRVRQYLSRISFPRGEKTKKLKKPSK